MLVVDGVASRQRRIRSGRCEGHKPHGRKERERLRPVEGMEDGQLLYPSVTGVHLWWPAMLAAGVIGAVAAWEDVRGEAAVGRWANY